MTTTKKIPAKHGNKAGNTVVIFSADSTAAATHLIAVTARHMSGTGQFCTETARVQQQTDAEWIAEYDAADYLVQPPVSAIIAPGATNTIDTAVATFAEKKVFSRPEFLPSLGLGVVEPQGHQHGCIHVSSPSPTLCPTKSVSGCQSRTGATMATANNSTTTPSMQGTTTHDHTTLSFVRVEFKGPRKQRQTNWFAVPDEPYGTGNATGYRVAAEFMNWVQSRPTTYETGLCVREIMAAAFAVLAEPCTPGELDKRGCAVTFLEAMSAFLMFAAQHSNHQAYLAGQAQRSVDWAKESALMDAERNRETGRRLAAARAAKRAARMAESEVAQ